MIISKLLKYKQKLKKKLNKNKNNTAHYFLNQERYRIIKIYYY